MGSLSAAHWLVVLVVIFVLFGKNRLSETMADLGKGLRSFREGLTEDETQAETAVIETLPVDARSGEEQT
ncbi:MAG: twin-arginine translocase TatA/TatE family subunit [Parasphingorhabdus sp.]|uniref:twin-arginine translocase TatA/TatE family subunit n=1 Tax=Parasphingorhabdus sp. TaxID=2709688 RepID=UPI0030037FCB